MRCGMAFSGPGLVVEYSSTVWVPEGSEGDLPSVPLLGPLAYGVLASLLAATGAVSRRR